MANITQSIRTGEQACNIFCQYNLPVGEYYTVSSVRWRDHLKMIRLEANKPRLVLPRSACVSTGDNVILSGEGAWVVCENGPARLLPSYVAVERIEVGGMDLEFVIKEITEPEEYIAYQALAQFHYRGQTIHGRTARLIVRNFHPIYPSVVGYIELATPFYMNKPRRAVLNAPFRMNDISWDAWDMETLRKYIHLVARIARCVVYPEFRGIGLGQTLIKHAVEFARDRWQVARLKPYFLEISADMLKFVPFAERAGMTFIGETEGNLGRVADDMAYLLKNRQRVESGSIVKEDACGIVDQQVARMSRALQILEREGWNTEELVVRLSRLSSTTVLRDFDLFHGIIALPKPTYMKGLVPEADDFVRRRAMVIDAKNGHRPPDVQLQPLAGAVSLENVSLTFQSRVRRTQQTHAIQQAFGISPDEIFHEVIRDLSIAIHPGEVVLVTGASGSGKSTLLRLFAEGPYGKFSGTIHWPHNYQPGTFRPIRSKKALIEALGNHDVNKTLHLMGTVGLSDAFVYLKRFDELSNGQQYRAMLAQLITTDCNVWIADEFCANLDPVTANVVASRLQATARKLGATLIVASSQPETFLFALKPDKVVYLTSAWEHRCVPGKELMKAMSYREKGYHAPILRISPEYLTDVLSGRKCATIRKGRRLITNGLLLLKADDMLITVNVVETRYCRFRSLTEEEAMADGFEDLQALHSALKKHYPDIYENSWVTVIRFNTVCNLNIT